METHPQAGDGNWSGLYSHCKDSRQTQEPDLRTRGLQSHHTSPLSSLPLSPAGMTGSSFNFRFHPAPSDRANRCRALSVWESSLPGFQRTDRNPAPPGCVVHTRGARTDVNDCSIRHGTPGCKHRAWSLEVVQHIFVEGGCLSCWPPPGGFRSSLSAAGGGLPQTQQ